MRLASSHPGGCHLVLDVDDPARLSRHAVELGARVQPRDSCAIEMRSPGGLLFSITAWSGESRRPLPASWPGGQRSLVDQICIDIPPATYDLECDFWASITGAEPLPGGRPEFRYLRRATGMPLRLLLQRLLDAPAGAASAHLDLACNDRAVDVHRHGCPLGSFLRQCRHRQADRSGLAPRLPQRRKPPLGGAGAFCWRRVRGRWQT